VFTEDPEERKLNASLHFQRWHAESLNTSQCVHSVHFL